MAEQYWVIVPAAGVGVRLGAAMPKQYLMIHGKTVLEHSLAAFLTQPWVKHVIVPLATDDNYFAPLAIAKNPKLSTTEGGITRADSVLAGILALEALGAQADDWVLVHDAVRCCLSEGDLLALKSGLANDVVGGILAVPVQDTLKRSAEGNIKQTIDRQNIWQAQTPQMFRMALLKEALQHCITSLLNITDDASAIEQMGQPVKIIEACYPNPKLTYPRDLAFMANLLKQEKVNNTMIRIGHGYDIHRFADNPTKDFVVLGGVKIPYEKGLEAHSDGDVLIHAICDALLGACALGDIGKHFPDTDSAYKNCDSRILLRYVVDKIDEQGYTVGNVDASIIAQAPRLSVFTASMCEHLAQDLRIPVDAVNVKATTNEKLDALGQKLGIAVHAVAILVKKI